MYIARVQGASLKPSRLHIFPLTFSSTMYHVLFPTIFWGGFQNCPDTHASTWNTQNRLRRHTYIPAPRVCLGHTACVEIYPLVVGGRRFPKSSRSYINELRLRNRVGIQGLGACTEDIRPRSGRVRGIIYEVSGYIYTWTTRLIVLSYLIMNGSTDLPILFVSRRRFNREPFPTGMVEATAPSIDGRSIIQPTL